MSKHTTVFSGGEYGYDPAEIYKQMCAVRQLPLEMKLRDRGWTPTSENEHFRIWQKGAAFMPIMRNLQRNSAGWDAVMKAID